jgi:hypothetical protein
MAASSIHQRGRSKRLSHFLKARNSRSLHFRFTDDLKRQSCSDAQCFDGSIGSKGALAHKRKSRPMGDHQAGSSGGHGAVPENASPDVTTGLVGWKYAGKTD